MCNKHYLKVIKNAMLNIQISSSPVEAVIYQPKNISPIGGIVLLHGSEGGSATCCTTNN